MNLNTTDLCDQFEDQLQIAEPIFRNFGRKAAFHGTIQTVKAFEDNSLVRKSLEQPGNGSVLVVDAGGSLRCAMLGDLLAEMGHKNGWSGVIVFGAIRDSSAIAKIDIGVKALATMPNKSQKRGEGQTAIPVRFAGVTFQPGAYLYSDDDGIVIASKSLH